MENKNQELSEQELDAVNGGWSVEYSDEFQVITFRLDPGDNPLTAATQALTANGINWMQYLGELQKYYTAYGDNLTNGTYTGCRIYLKDVDKEKKTATIVNVEVF